MIATLQEVEKSFYAVKLGEQDPSIFINCWLEQKRYELLEGLLGNKMSEEAFIFTHKSVQLHWRSNTDYDIIKNDISNGIGLDIPDDKRMDLER